MVLSLSRLWTYFDSRTRVARPPRLDPKVFSQRDLADLNLPEDVRAAAEAHRRLRNMGMMKW